MMKSSVSTFCVTKAPLKLARRPWVVAKFWEKFFPFDREGRVYFMSPWDRGPVYEIKTATQAKELISRLKAGFLVGGVIFAFLLLSTIFFFWTTQWFFPLVYAEVGLSFWLLRHLVYPSLLQFTKSEYETVSFDVVAETRVKGAGCTLTGASSRPGFYIRVWLSFLPVAMAYMGVRSFFTAQYADSMVFWWVAGIASLSIVPIVYWQKLYGEAPLRIAECIVIATFYVGSVPMWYGIYKPVAFRDIPPWGYGYTSLLSDRMSKLQDVISAPDLDRKLQFIQYMPSGSWMDIARFSMKPEELNALMSSMKKSPLVKLVSDSLSDREKYLLLKRYEVERFPYWWAVSPEIRFMQFVPTEAGIAAGLPPWSWTLIYDLPSQQLFVINEERVMTPFESLRQD